MIETSASCRHRIPGCTSPLHSFFHAATAASLLRHASALIAGSGLVVGSAGYLDRQAISPVEACCTPGCAVPGFHRGVFDGMNRCLVDRGFLGGTFNTCVARVLASIAFMVAFQRRFHDWVCKVYPWGCESQAEAGPEGARIAGSRRHGGSRARSITMFSVAFRQVIGNRLQHPV